MKIRFITISLTAVTIVFSACHNEPAKTIGTEEKSNTGAVKKDSSETTDLAPIIQFVDTLRVPAIFVCMKDSASSSDRIGMKLGTIYGKIKPMLEKNKIAVAGAPAAWYQSQKAPFFFEAGLPVLKAPAKLGAGMYIKELKADSVLLVHFYGPYEKTLQAYTAVEPWMTGNGKISSGAPYEVYVDDPVDATGKLKDPYKVRTDIVFPRKKK